MKKDPLTVRCHACRGRFGFGVDDDRPTAYHSLPFCPAFNAIATTIDALRFAQQCDINVIAEKKP